MRSLAPSRASISIKISMRLYQGAAEAVKLGHIELVSGYSPAGEAQA
jgi:hypothetical protein